MKSEYDSLQSEYKLLHHQHHDTLKLIVQLNTSVKEKDQSLVEQTVTLNTQQNQLNALQEDKQQFREELIDSQRKYQSLFFDHHTLQKVVEEHDRASTES